MLEHATHQAASLTAWEQSCKPSVVAMLTVFQSPHEQSLLWSVCERLMHQGLACLVLDTTTAETPLQPGLRDWVQAESRYHFPPEPELEVWPAQSGLDMPPFQSKRSHHHLMQRMSGAGVVIWVGSAKTLQAITKTNPNIPSFMFAEDDHSETILSAYASIKHFVKSGLNPPWVGLIGRQPGDTKPDNRMMGGALKKCVRTHLQVPLKTHPVNIDPVTNENNQLLDAWLIRMVNEYLEKACPNQVGSLPIRLPPWSH